MAATRSVVPFRQFVLKVHSRCDLACDHCYVYEHADQSWRGRPKLIANETVARTAERIEEHARVHGLAGVRVIMHGGEPLLAGAPRLGEIARTLRRTIEQTCALDLRIHTNAVRLDVVLAELFLAERVKVGVSLDGDKAANDLHRRYRDGRSSYDQVMAAVNLLRTERYRPIFAGLLATIDVRSDPVAVYRSLAGLEPPALDFLLPHATWDEPPPGTGGGATPYADWLAAVFAEWDRDGRRVPVRMFESVIATTLGGSSGTESLGLAPSDVAVIETDGQIEQADSIKVAYDGAPATGLDIFRNALDEAAAHAAITARQRGIAGLSATCRQCPVVTSCGGGLYAHRYRAGHGFGHPSVYCADLEKIIRHIRARIRPSAATAAVTPAAGQRAARQLPAAHFDALAAGFGDAESVGYLAAAQRTLRRKLLRLVREQDGATSPLFGAAWQLMARLDREHPAALDGVLAHPYVRAWAEHSLPAPGRPPVTGQREDPGYLACVVMAAAIRAGVPAELEAPAIDGYLPLPTLGRLRVGAATTATVMTAGGGFEVRAASGKWHVEPGDELPDPDWQPVRALSADGYSVALEDTDPYRDCHGWPAAARLSDEVAAAWQRQFTVAWELIELAYPAYAPAIRAGLSTLMPLDNTVPGREIAASARHAYGAIGVALPPTAEDLAQLLIHEFQHVKLGAIQDMFDLNTEDGRKFFAPWRDDPRPVGALLQGTYAHIGVTDYWRVRRHRVTGEQALDAAEHFARWRLFTAEAIDTLAGSQALTELGDRFVAGMRATVEPWLAEPVPAAVAARARRRIAERRQQWQRLRDAEGDADGRPRS